MSLVPVWRVLQSSSGPAMSTDPSLDLTSWAKRSVANLQEQGGVFLMYSNTRPECEKETTPSWWHKLVGDTTEKTLPASVTGELVDGSWELTATGPVCARRRHQSSQHWPGNAYWTFRGSFLGFKDVLLGKQTSGFCFLCLLLSQAHSIPQEICQGL